MQVLFGALVNSGQVCMSTERVLVHQNIQEAFEAELVKAVRTLDQRKPFDLIRPGAAKEADALAQDAVRAVCPASLRCFSRLISSQDQR